MIGTNDIKLKVLCWISDTSGCFEYRCRIPFDALRAHGVYVSYYCFLPSDPVIPQDQILVDMIKQFDIVIVQRCYILPLVQKVASICEFLGIPLVFETDDNYASLEPHNPAYFAVCDDQTLFKTYMEHREQAVRLAQAGKSDESKEESEKANSLVPSLLESRARGLEQYKELLRLVDWVQVSTEELAQSVRPYNRNVAVFQNNVDRIYPWKDAIPAQACYKKEGDKTFMQIIEQLGLYTVPSYNIHADNKNFDTIVRVGYTGTESHRGPDFETIREGLNEFARNNTKTPYYYVFLGDPWFYHQLEDQSKVFSLKGSGYDKYFFNIKNIDVMLCPLTPSLFNMAKSDIKLVEAGAWGIPGLAPRFITYSRNWKEEENCLMYSTQEEFVYQLERLVKDHALRQKLGQAAFDYVASERLEMNHSQKRFDFYTHLAKKKRLDTFKPNKEKAC